MIKEAYYCSFEVAKLLKEKGFTEECEYFYDWYKESESYHICSNGGTCNNEKYPDEYSMPTQAMVCAWLREVHNIFIEIGTSIDLNGDYHFDYTILDKKCRYVRRGYTDFDWNYEDAMEAAIKYCLENLI